MCLLFFVVGGGGGDCVCFVSWFMFLGYIFSITFSIHPGFGVLLGGGGGVWRAVALLGGDRHMCVYFCLWVFLWVFLGGG